MSETDLTSLGIDQSAAEALARANVRSVQDLLRADPEQAAMASGIPIERIQDWQRKARRTGASRPGSPVAKAWLIGVVLVLIALLLGWALMAIGAGRVRKAEQIRTAAESKLSVAVAYVAGEAISQVRDARLAINKNNWGSAQVTLSQVGEKIAFMRQVAPDNQIAAIDKISEELTRLQKSASEQSKDTVQQLDALETSLDALPQG
jgi:hypothetical protein